MFIGFLPTLVLRSALMSPLRMPNFSVIGVHITFIFYGRFCKVYEKKVEEKKRRKKSPNFDHGNGQSDFFQIWNVDSPTAHAHVQ